MMAPAKNPFGAPSASAKPPASNPFAPSGFGQPSGQSTPFGAPSLSAPASAASSRQPSPSLQPAANPFGPPSGSSTAFGAPSKPSSAFANGAQSRPNSSSPFATAAPNANPFGAPSQPEKKPGGPASLSNPFAPPGAAAKTSSAKPPSTTPSLGPGQVRRSGPQQMNAAARDLRQIQEQQQQHLNRSGPRVKSPAVMMNGSAKQPVGRTFADKKRRDDGSDDGRPRPTKPPKGRTSPPTEETRRLSAFAGDFADKLNKQLRKDGLGSPPHWPPEPGNPDKRGPMDKLKETYKKYRTKVYSSLRKAELIDDPDKRRKLEDALPFKGVCEDMCPEYEQLTRICEFDVKQEEKERSPDGMTTWAEPSLMVKKFGRSAAGQDAPLPTDVRSVDALKRTTGYLLGDLLQRDEDLPALHNFLWDRTRAVRKDFTFHSTKTAEEMKALVHCFETITRFHATALHLLSRKGFAAEDFDQKQEIEQLGRSLLSLMEAYDDCREKGVECDNECEFRAYHLLLNTHDPFIVQRSREWGREPWFDSDEIQLALSLIHAMQNVEEPRGPLRPPLGSTLTDSSFTNFFSIVENPKVSYAMACFAEVHFTYVRQRILKAIVKAYSRRRDWPRDITAPVLNAILRFDTQQEAVEFAEQHDFEFTSENADQPYLVLRSKRKHVPSPRVRQSSSGQLVERKRGKRPLSYVVHHTIFEETAAPPADANVSASEEEDSHDTLFVTQPASPAALSRPKAVEPAETARSRPSNALPPGSVLPRAAITTGALSSYFAEQQKQGSGTTEVSRPPPPGAAEKPSPFAPQGFHQPSSASSPFAATASTPALSVSKPPPEQGGFSFPKNDSSQQPQHQAFGAPSSSSATPASSFFPSAPLQADSGKGKEPAFPVSPFSAAQPQQSQQSTGLGQNASFSSALQTSPSNHAAATTGGTTSMPPPKAPSTSFFPPSSTPSSSPFSPIPPPSQSFAPSAPSLPPSFPAPTSTTPTNPTTAAAKTPSISAPATGSPIAPSAPGDSGPSKSQQEISPPNLSSPHRPSSSSTSTVPPPFGQQKSSQTTGQPSLGHKQPFSSAPSSSATQLSQAAGGPDAPPATPAPKQQSLPPAPADPMGSFTEWFVKGDGGLMEQFIDVTVADIVRNTFEQWRDGEEKRRREEEDEASWVEARTFQVYNLRVKFFYRWQKNARALAQRRILREGRARMKAFHEQERAAEKAKKDADRHAAEEARRKARADENLAKLLHWETHRPVTAAAAKPKPKPKPKPTSNPSPEKQLLATRVFSGCKDEQETARRVVRDAYHLSGSDSNHNSSLPSSRRSSFASSQDSTTPAKREGWKTRSLREQYGLEPPRSAISASSSTRQRQRSISVSSSVNGHAPPNFSRSAQGAPPASKVTNFSSSSSFAKKRFGGGESSDEEPSSKRKQPSNGNSIKSTHWELRARGFVLMPNGQWLPESIALPMQQGKRFKGIGDGGLGPGRDEQPPSAASPPPPPQDGPDLAVQKIKLDRLAARFGFPESRRSSLSDVADKAGASDIINHNGTSKRKRPLGDDNDEGDGDDAISPLSAGTKRRGRGNGTRADGSPPSPKRPILLPRDSSDDDDSNNGDGDGEKGETDKMVEDTQQMLRDLRKTMDEMDEDRSWFREQVDLMEKRQSMWD